MKILRDPIRKIIERTLRLEQRLLDAPEDLRTVQCSQTDLYVEGLQSIQLYQKKWGTPRTFEAILKTLHLDGTQAITVGDKLSKYQRFYREANKISGHLTGFTEQIALRVHQEYTPLHLSILLQRDRDFLEWRLRRSDRFEKIAKRFYEEFELTRERVRQIGARALHKLRHFDRQWTIQYVKMNPELSENVQNFIQTQLIGVHSDRVMVNLFREHWERHGIEPIEVDGEDVVTASNLLHDARFRWLQIG